MNKKRYISKPGYDRLWGWFGLSYASFLVIPRVLLHEMPDEWQDKLADLLEEYDDTWDWEKGPDVSTRVSFVKRGKFVKAPRFLCNYRHPDMQQIEALKKKKKEIEGLRQWQWDMLDAIKALPKKNPIKFNIIKPKGDFKKLVNTHHKKLVAYYTKLHKRATRISDAMRGTTTTQPKKIILVPLVNTPICVHDIPLINSLGGEECCFGIEGKKYFYSTSYNSIGCKKCDSKMVNNIKRKIRCLMKKHGDSPL